MLKPSLSLSFSLLMLSIYPLLSIYIFTLNSLIKILSLSLLHNNSLDFFVSVNNCSNSGSKYFLINYILFHSLSLSNLSLSLSHSRSLSVNCQNKCHTFHPVSTFNIKFTSTTITSSCRFNYNIIFLHN